MEMLGAILELAKITFVPIRDCCNYHRHVDEHMKNLRVKWQDLDHLKSDIRSRLEAQLPGKTAKLLVTTWFERVESMRNEIQAIESEYEEVKCFFRACVGEHALKKKKAVDELFQMGSDFPDSLVVDPAVRNGEKFATTELIGKITTERVMKEILADVLNDDVRRIGVWGMGGIGKSSIMEHISNLLTETNKFDWVIWVTMSKSCDVIQLQNDIAHKLNLDLKDNNKRERAAKIMKEFKGMKRGMLILDDLWEEFDLKEVGIPETGCKIVLTTRDLNVCRRMRCKPIQMDLLLEDEARELFFYKMEDEVINNPCFKAIAEEVLQICARLPLAIVTMANSFQCLTDDFEWRDALERLKTSLKGFDKMEDKVYKTLEFSYDRLKEDELKQCLLHCALYPEDFKIFKNELIEHLIDEGIIERMKSRQREFDRGKTILKRLENACLLEGGIACHIPEGKFVKMHDLVRDMVLEVASPQFMVEGRLRLEDFSNEEKWREDLVKASLMYKGISTIPSNVSPRCPNLSTLLLRGNKSLKNVPDSLFKHLHGLKVLDLAYTGIKALPNSVFSLEKLTALTLRGCRRLNHMSSLAKLTALRKLDLGETGITEVPDGLEMLVKLTYLNLNAKNLKIMPIRILPKLSRLQYLRFSCIVKVKKEEIESLKKLENVWVRFDDLDEFCSFIRSLEGRQLACYQIQVGKSVEDLNQKIEDEFFSFKRSFEGRQLAGYPIQVGKSVEDLDQKIEDEEKIVILEDCNLRRGDESLVLRKDLQFLKLKTCEGLRSLCDIPSLKLVSELKKIRIEDCEGIEHVVSSTSPSSSFTDSLQTLELLKLKNLRGLFRQERAASGWVPLGTFSRLKVIFIHECPIKKLLPLGLLLHLDNLEEIRVENCLELEEIIAEACDEFEGDEEEKEEKGMDTTKITLPKLRVLNLKNLPELKAICSSSKVIVCDSLERVEIFECQKLKRLPLPPSAPPSLQHIQGTIEWWESVAWDCPDTKTVFQPFFQPFFYSAEEYPSNCTIC
ncbi:hypothetical protein ACJW30_06G057500 [Castanea mollissima]